MICADIEAFAAALPEFGAVLGLDFGQRTVGVAVSDVTRAIASPLLLIERRNREADMAEVLKAASGREAVGAVIGLPLQMDGAEGERAEITRKFAERLAAAWDAPLVLWDERLSTAGVERLLIGEADLTRRRRKQVVDKSAAAFILQGALDRIGNLRR
ncbi:putative Holliday junction resolvase [uncultured Alphaproteobacteria bacterium]|uniref:Putative pre-16S rRNA nuclease n=1 Tax=uncultured Alphaproteobacteria bacterium TaxID=91750 RepID=A0A212JGE7_9PROT|nr:putative Holliday junction resolvase [uncultured Alphaproteobacteria bacterium]